MTKAVPDPFTRRVGTTPMKDRTGNRTDLPGRTSLLMVVTEEGKESTSIPHDQPRAISRINDNYCVTKLQARLLAGSPSTEKTIDTCLNVKYHVAPSVHTAPGHSQKEEVSPGSAGCYVKKNRLKYVKSVSCVTQLSSVQPVTNVRNVALNLPVGARLQTSWHTWLDLGVSLKVVQILKEGYPLPFRIRPKLTRSPTVVSCYVNPHRNSHLL